MNTLSHVIAKAVTHTSQGVQTNLVHLPKVAVEERQNVAVDAPCDSRPEEFLSQGLALSFLRELHEVLKQRDMKVDTLEVSVEVTLKRLEKGAKGYEMIVLVCLDELDASTSETIIKQARASCPIMQSLRRNISLTIHLNTL